MPQVNVNGATLSYYVDAAADAPLPAGTPLVLLHGFPLDARVWADVGMLTAARHPTLRPNLRGFGSLTSMEAFTIDSLAVDLHEMLEQLGMLPCVLAGLSMGGYVALAFAEHFGDALAGLALVDTRPDADDDAARQRREDTIALVRRSGAPAVAGAMHPRLLAPSTYATRPAVADALMRIMLDTPSPTIEQASIAMRDRPDRTALLSRLDMPALVVVGAEDAITPPAVAQRMAGMLQRGKLVTVPESGHLTPLENAPAVAEALMDLMDRANQHPRIPGAGGVRRFTGGI